MGGLKPGGLNFDAKVRRASHEPIDLFYAHIGGMDAFAHGLKIAHRIVEDGRLAEFVEQRYGGWNEGIGERIKTGRASLDDCANHALSAGEPERKSGRQEYLENLVNTFL
jgi:xylose isomerase